MVACEITGNISAEATKAFGNIFAEATRGPDIGPLELTVRES
jgi:hypothetical protein